MAKKLNVNTDDLSQKLSEKRSEIAGTDISENKKKRVGLYFDDDLIDWLKATAKKRHCSVNNVVVQLIVDAKDKEV